MEDKEYTQMEDNSPSWTQREKVVWLVGCRITELVRGDITNMGCYSATATLSCWHCKRHILNINGSCGGLNTWTQNIGGAWRIRTYFDWLVPTLGIKTMNISFEIYSPAWVTWAEKFGPFDFLFSQLLCLEHNHDRVCVVQCSNRLICLKKVTVSPIIYFVKRL